MTMPVDAQRYVAARLSIERRRIVEEYEKRDADAVQDLISQRLSSSNVRVLQHLKSRVGRAKALGEAHLDAYFAACDKVRHVPDPAELDRLERIVTESCQEEEERARKKLLDDLDQMNVGRHGIVGQLEASIRSRFGRLRQEFRASIITRRFELGAAQSSDKGSRRKRKAVQPQSRRSSELTARQLEVLRLANEHMGNLSEVARLLGLDPSTVRQHHTAATMKLGSAGVAMAKQRTRRLPKDRRGQIVLADDSESEPKGNDS